MKSRIALGLLTSASIAAMMSVAPTPALAQNATKTDKVETVVVTALRREQSLDTVAAAVSAVGGDQIESRRIEDLGDLTIQTPNMQFTSSTPDQAFVAIRGSFASASDGPGADQGVAIYVDDIYTMGPSDIPHDFNDLNRIEILRGPQGTLFGRNVTGGLISIYTNAPTFTPEFALNVTAGNYGLWQASGYANGPIVGDVLAGRLNLYINSRNGYERSTTTGGHFGDQNSWEARGQLVFQPNENFTLRIGGSHTEDDSDSAALSLIGDAPFISDNPVPGSVASYDPAATNQKDPGIFERTMDDGFGRFDWHTSIGTLTSITGYRKMDLHLAANSLADPGTTFGGFFAEPTTVYNFDGLGDDHQFTEELRLASPDDQQLTWIVGVFYLDNTRDRLEVLPDGIVPFLFGGPATQHQIVDLRSWSIFGDATYRISDEVSLSAGLRYSSDRKVGSTFKDGLFTATTLPESSIGYSGTWSAATPRASLSYQPNEHMMWYALISRGFKGGGFDFGGSTAPTFGQPYEPEYVWNYEGGARTNWLDHTLTLNAIVYRQNYTNLQLRVAAIVGGVVTTATSNAGKAFSQGLEVEFNYAPSDLFSVGMNFTYNDSRLSNYITAAGPLTNVPTPLSPKYSTTLFWSSNIPVPEDVGALRVDASYAYHSTMWLRASDAFTGVPNFLSEPALIHNRTALNGRVDMSATWTSPEGRFEAELWGKNLTNERSVTSGLGWTPLAAPFYGYAGSFLGYASYTDPTTFGLTLRAKI